MTGTSFENLVQVDISEITVDFLPNRLTYLQKSVVFIAQKLIAKLNVMTTAMNFLKVESMVGETTQTKAANIAVEFT